MSFFEFDTAIREWIPHSATLTKGMIWISILGNWKFVVGLALIISALCWMNRRRNIIIPFLFALAGTEFTVEILKLTVHRARPIGGAFLEHSYSFPSGHSAISVALYGFLAFALWNHTKSKLLKIALIVLTTLLILSIGFSRIYLGAHYPTDVIGGYLCGALFLWIATHLPKHLKIKLPK